MIRVRIAGDERWLAIEDAGRVRDALGAALPVGVPEAFTEPVRDPLGDLVSRFARTHGPFVGAEVAERLGLGIAVVGTALARLAASGRVVQGEFRPGGIATEWCDAEVLRAIRRRSLAALRREVEPVPHEALARFIPAWQGLGTRSARGADGLMRAVEQLAGVAVPASALETLILPGRVAGYSPALLDELTLAGDVVWAGAGTLAGNDGWIVLAPAEIAPLVLDAAESVDDPLAERVRAALAADEALFFKALSDRATAPGDFVTDDAFVRAVWELVWAGLLTNDTLAPIRSRLAGGKTSHRSPSRARPQVRRHGRYSGLAAPGGAASSLPTDPAWDGRSLVRRSAARCGRDQASIGRRRRPARSLRRGHPRFGGGRADHRRVRCGLPVLKAAEESGRARRGYFVEGLGAAQFALPGAVDRLRAEARPLDVRGAAGSAALVLAATDPANPYGAALPWPEAPRPEDGGRGHQPARKAGALVVLVEGACVLYVERGRAHAPLLRRGRHAPAACRGRPGAGGPRRRARQARCRAGRRAPGHRFGPGRGAVVRGFPADATWVAVARMSPRCRVSPRCRA